MENGDKKGTGFWVLLRQVSEDSSREVAKETQEAEDAMQLENLHSARRKLLGSPGEQ